MMKKVRAIIIGIAIIFVGINCQNVKVNAVEIYQDAKVTTEGIKYKIDGDTIQILGYSGDKESIEIPEKIEDKTVTSIGRLAFQFNATIKQIILPNTIMNIQDTAFMGCKIEKIVIPKSVIDIGDYAFEGCRDMVEINIESGVKSIGDNVFTGCNKLTTLSIPDSVTSIGKNNFGDCWELKEINVSENNSTYSSQGGILFDKNKTELISVPPTFTEVTIPDSVSSIKDNAFESCFYIEQVNVSKNISNIGEKVFYSCNGLTQIVVDKDNPNYTSENGILYNKDKSLLIAVPAQLKDINIPSTVTQIEEYAFSGCSNLRIINLSDNITNIGDCAFFRCSSLMEINIPASTSYLGRGVFTYCDAKIVVDENNPNYSSEEGILFNKDKTIIMKVPGMVEKVNIPDSVNTIGEGAFSNCRKLKEIIIPKNVSKIEYDAFGFCSFLESVTIENKDVIIDNLAFMGCYSVKIHGLEDRNNDNSPVKTTKYTVKFVNEDGTQVGEIQQIEEGKSAVAPENPTKEGYTFKGWDKEFNNVTSNIEVKAIFEKNSDNSSQGGEKTATGTQESNKTTITPQDGNNNKTADIASIAVGFTMFAGLLGVFSFRKKEK